MTARPTAERLLRAATAVFAEHGFHGAKVRDIAERARVNLAAINYHFGSKRELYLEVLRSQFRLVRQLLEERGADATGNEIDHLDPSGLRDLLERRCRAMLEFLIGPPPSPYATLMQWEMLAPSEALPVIVREFLQPMTRPIRQVVARLAPDLSPGEIERAAFSIVGQTIFYRTAMPAMLLMRGESSYPRGFAADVSRHIAAFSVGGVERISSRKEGRRGRRRK